MEERHVHERRDVRPNRSVLRRLSTAADGAVVGPGNGGNSGWGDVSHQQEDSLDLFHGASNVIFDHCSATWSLDECFSTSGNDSNFTIQWCLIGQALNDSFHSKGPHGYGSLARASGNGSWIHNLWADNLERNPRPGDNYGQELPAASFIPRVRRAYLRRASRRKLQNA